jgi:hypothetical protein
MDTFSPVRPKVRVSTVSFFKVDMICKTPASHMPLLTAITWRATRMRCFTDLGEDGFAGQARGARTLENPPQEAVASC